MPNVYPFTAYSMNSENSHSEVASTVAMLVPSLVSLKFLLMNQERMNNEKIIIAAIGCILHFPFSAMLHLYRAYGKDPRRRTFLYKLDVSFIHVHAFMQSYSWNLKFSLLLVIYHLFSIAYIWASKPLEYPKCKRYIDACTAFGILLCSYDLIHIDKSLYFAAIAMWGVAFTVYSTKFFGDIPSSILFHGLLAGPQYCLLQGLSMQRP